MNISCENSFFQQLSNVLNLQLLDPPGYDDCLLSIWFKRRCCHLSPLRAYASTPAAVSVQICFSKWRSVFMHVRVMCVWELARARTRVCVYVCGCVCLCE